jgi:hypothetical protein
MRQGRRYGLSAAQSIDIWRLWKAGESLHEIGRAFAKDHGSIQFLLSKRRGIAPPVRRRSLRTLTLDEREDISRDIAFSEHLATCAQRTSIPHRVMLSRGDSAVSEISIRFDNLDREDYRLTQRGRRLSRSAFKGEYRGYRIRAETDRVEAKGTRVQG